MFEKGDFMETIRNMEINQLHDFRNHPFKVEVNTELCELMKSIEKEGVLVPLLVRTKVLLAAAKMAEKIVDVVYEKVVEKEVPVLVEEQEQAVEIREKVQLPKKPEEPLLLSKYLVIMELDAELKRRNKEIFAVEQERGDLEIELSECSGVFKQKQRKELQERITLLDKKVEKMKAELSKVLWDAGYANAAEFFTELFAVHEEKRKYEEACKVWQEECVKENLAAVKYSTEAKVDEKIVAQRKAFEKAINMQWLDAANAIKIVKDKENDKKTKGYLCQIQAEYINKIDSALSQEILKVGKNLSAAILSPLAGIQYQRTINTIPQAQAISTNLLAGKLGLNELLVYIDGVLSNLCIGSEYEKFEEALNQIGVVLGFVCSRPDKETGGYGPDNLWAIDSNKYLVIECKTEAITQTIKKDYCNQLSGSVNWFKENYVYPNECTPIIVHPSKFVDVVASPDENMRVMTEEELTCFRKNIRDFYSALCHNGSISDISKINELLSIYKLRKDDIVNRYTVKFERQK